MNSYQLYRSTEPEVLCKLVVFVQKFLILVSFRPWGDCF
jgi:hypothetical protein